MNPKPEKTLIAEIGQLDFETEVVRAAAPSIVVFCAPWSRPCHVLDQALEAAAISCEGVAKVFRVDADDNPDLGLWYDIQSIPTLLFFCGGSVRARLVGTASKEAILARLGVAMVRASEAPSDSEQEKL
jgi:thioredoxin 1